MRKYEQKKEEVIRDKDGQLVRVRYDDDIVFHRHYKCDNCGWTGEIDYYPDLKLCPTCGTARGEHGLHRRLWYNGPWADARLDELKNDIPSTGCFNPEAK
jgi:hypothetical protein